MVRNFFTSLVLLAALGISGAAGFEVVRQALNGPPPVIIDGVEITGDDFDRGVLHTLLAYEFDRSDDRSSKRFVLEMLEDRLNQGADIVGEWKTLSRRDRLRVQNNVLALAPVWLHDHTEAYFTRPPQLRPDYLDTQITQLLIWAQAASPIGADRENVMRDIDVARIQAELYDWINGLNPEDRQRYLVFMHDLRDRALNSRQRRGGRRW